MWVFHCRVGNILFERLSAGRFIGGLNGVRFLVVSAFAREGVGAISHWNLGRGIRREAKKWPKYAPTTGSDERMEKERIK